MTSRPKTQKPKAGKTRARETRTRKRPGVIASVSAGAEKLSIYVGNSAAVNDAIEAEEAFGRADAWARGDKAVYGEVKR